MGLPIKPQNVQLFDESVSRIEDLITKMKVSVHVTISLSYINSKHRYLWQDMNDEDVYAFFKAMLSFQNKLHVDIVICLNKQQAYHILPKINATAYLHARYPTTMRDLQGIFDGIHLLVGSAGGNYGCIVVDDLQKYFTTPPQVNTQHLMT